MKGQRFVMFPWRNMICDDCRERGLPESVWYFYSHFWGTGHNHVCPPLTKAEMMKESPALISALNNMRDEFRY